MSVPGCACEQSENEEIGRLIRELTMKGDEVGVCRLRTKDAPDGEWFGYSGSFVEGPLRPSVFLALQALAEAVKE